MEDEQAIGELHAALCKTVAAGNLEGALQHFAPDAMRVDERGKTQRGRSAIRIGLERLFGESDRGAIVRIRDPKVRRLSTHVAIWESPVDVIPKRTGILRQVHLLDVLQKDSAGWHIVESHPQTHSFPETI